MNALARALERSWYGDEPGVATLLAPLLGPLAGIHGALVAARRRRFRDGRARVEPSALPVIVVGNLTVGGTGKTPLTAHLVEAFRRRGWRPGIVSRGHGGERHERPHRVGAGDTAALVGDEPLMLHRRTGVPVCVCVRRARAVAALAESGECDLVLSDDGLQHLAMARDAEIVVIDGASGFGNGRLLPAGPLREPATRLYEADLVAVRHDAVWPGTAACEADATPDDAARAGTVGDTPLDGVPGVATLEPGRLPPAFAFANAGARVRALPAGDWSPLGPWRERSVHAVAGIARPQRFFDMLSRHGLEVTPHPLPDHHVYRASDLAFDDERPVLVTSKDAVKLDAIASPPGGLHEVAVELRTDPACETLLDALSARLQRAEPASEPS